jgi:lysophospholipase L1-like esterase
VHGPKTKLRLTGVAKIKAVAPRSNPQMRKKPAWRDGACAGDTCSALVAVGSSTLMKSIALPFLALALLVHPAWGQNRQIVLPWPEPPRPADVPWASFPAPRLDWIARFETNIDKLKNGPYDLVFDGDSITDGWQGGGKEVWQAHYGRLKAVDLGIGGDQVQHVTWRAQNGSLAGQDPKLIVIMIGTNNIFQKEADVAAGIKMLLDEYEKRCPASHILLLGIFPRDPVSTSKARTWVSDVNKIISTYDADKRITYLDIGAKFLEPDGSIAPAMMPDGLHPTAKGYEIWADAIQPLVDQYVPKPAGS